MHVLAKVFEKNMIEIDEKGSFFVKYMRIFVY